MKLRVVGALLNLVRVTSLAAICLAVGAATSGCGQSDGTFGGVSATESSTPGLTSGQAPSPPAVATLASGRSTDAGVSQSGLRPASELGRACETGGRTVKVPEAGEPAVDFTLRDTGGMNYTLSELLRQKPVLLIFGSFT